ncbi:pro-neuregulin-1, membrane-bound isoform isoform X1 [Panthera uncia]|uniref:pro-neuregulin-1, membrane-bound isoform isoform X1 n=1 Tax=Panthera uncia TaxID=29064 RepID=UPI0020FF8521|nr:pro-neuregulin-1, membrane-bound isoform isoform X1 [Panthera uncia]XP_060509160.1 pro-neuregulin-1, membrane-bound isoform isoform X3 [Panthera onca]
MRWRRSPRRSGSAGPRAPRPGSAARSPPPLLPLLLLWTAALGPGAAAGDEAAPAGASVCYSSPPSVGSVQELAQRAAVVIEGKVHPPRRQQGALDRKAAAGEAGAWGGEREPPAAGPGALGPPAPDPLPTANGTVPSWPGAPAPGAGEPGDEEAPYLVKVHQVWAVKAGGLKKDSLLTVRLGAWGHPAFPSCGRLKEDSRYIFFMEPDANSSSRAPAAFRASFPPLETGRNLKKEVSRVLCKRCALPPRLKEMRSQESVAGSKLVLRCETSSEYSSLKFKWFKNGNELNRKNKPQNIKIQKKPGKSELRINKASLADSGEYMCRVTSKLGNDSASANITIVDSNEIITGMPASTERAYVSSESPIRISVSTEGANTSSSTSTSTTGTSHLVKCAEKEKTFCVNGGECFMVKDLSNPSRYLCKCPNEFTGDRCQNYVMASFYKAEELYQKRVLTITGICIALLVVGIMCVVAYCKTKKQRKKLHDRLRQSLRSERNNMVNIANGPHHPNPPPENVQLVNQYVSKNVISSEHIVEREAETSFSTSHYTSTAHHSTTVTQTPSHSWSNGHTESIISESHSVIMMSSVENSRHSSPSGGPRGRLNGVGGPRECNSFLRHARETPDSYRDSPHSERYVSAMTTPARMSPVDFHTPSSPKSPPSEMSPPVSGTTVSMPSMAVSPFVEEERPLLLVTPPRLREKYDRHPPQFTSYHHNPAHESNSLPPSPLRIVEDEEYETTQEYEPAQEPVKKLTSSRRPKRTKPNGHIANRLEMDSNASAEGTHSESETEDERVGEDTPFLGIQNPLAASLEAAPAFRLADSRTNPAGRFSPQEELQARLTSVIANQDPIAV